MIYLDYNASVPLRPAAQKAMLGAFEHVGNPSSPHALGRKLRAYIDEARREILKAIGGHRLVFTSGGTESNALALLGMGPAPLLVSSIEHMSVLKAASSTQRVPVTKEGMIDLTQLTEKLASFTSPGLLSLMLVNNETGVIQPIQEATRIAKEKGWKVHTDASQAFGHIPFSFEELNVDMMTLSSHKCGGPIGIGALILKEGVHLPPLFPGGGQEYGMRSGTLSTPLVLGFAAAVKEALNERLISSNRLKILQKKIEDQLPQAIVYGKKSPRVSHVSCLGMPTVPASLQLMAFDLKGIAVGTGAACSSGTMKESHVLQAMGISPTETQCAIRLSMGWNTQDDEIDTFITSWIDIFQNHTQRKAS